MSGAFTGTVFVAKFSNLTASPPGRDGIKTLARLSPIPEKLGELFGARMYRVDPYEARLDARLLLCGQSPGAKRRSVNRRREEKHIHTALTLALLIGGESVIVGNQQAAAQSTAIVETDRLKMQICPSL